MKIKLFIESAGIGGAEKMVLEMLTLLRERNIDASFLGVRKGWLTEELEKREIPAEFIQAGGKLKFPLNISSSVKASGVNLVHSHSLDTNFYSAMAAKMGGFKHLATEHGDVHHSDKRGNLENKLRVMQHLKTEFNSVSQFSRTKLIELGISENKVSAIPNPINLKQADYIDQREVVRNELGLSKDHWLWIHVANLRPVKDQQTLIKGFAKSLSESPNQALAILGDGEIRPELEKLTKELSIEKKVHFLGFRSDAPRYLAASDGFILSSLSEAMPMSLLEAAAMNLVLIGSRVGGIPEVINEKTGYLFESQDSENLAAVISTILKHKAAAKGKAKNANALALSTYSADSVITEYLKRYEQILS